MQRLFVGAHGLVVDCAGTAELCIVAVQDLLVGACHRCAQSIALAQDGVEVADHQDLLAGSVLAQEGDHALLRVVRHDPLEALPAVVHLPEGGVLLVEGIQGPDIGLQFVVLIVAQQHPVQRLCLVPLGELAELLSHEQQLLARVGHHIAEEGAQVCKLGVVLAGHLVDQAALAVHHLIVADGQHKVLAEGVEEAEGDLVVVAGTEKRVGLHVAEHVVHPAHVPLEIEAKAAVRSRLCDHGPCGGLFCDHVLVRMTAQHGVVQLAQEGNGLQIFLAAILVGLPFALLAVIVQIQHGCHSIHPQAVNMVLLQPVQCAGDQEALHLAAAEVKHHGAPLLMFTALRVRVLVAGLAVKVVQAELVLREVSRYPVHDHADAGGVQLVHKGHKVLGGAVAAGGCKIACDLIAPAAIKGVFHDRQQLHMGIAHIGDIRDQLVCQLGIVIGLAALLHLPAAGVHLVDVHGAVDHVRLFLCCLPCVIVPHKAGDIVDLAAVGRAGLGVECIGIGLIDQITCTGGHAIFVNIIFLHARDEQFPYGIAIHLAHRVAARLPAVEVAHHADRHSMGCPHAEHHARFTGARFHVCAEVTVCFTVIALFEQIHRKVRCIALDLFLGRFHRLLLPVQMRRKAHL